MHKELAFTRVIDGRVAKRTIEGEKRKRKIKSKNNYVSTRKKKQVPAITYTRGIGFARPAVLNLHLKAFLPGLAYWDDHCAHPR